MLVNNIAMSRWGPRIGLSLIRVLPRRMALWISAGITAKMARDSQANMIQSIRANQAVVRGLAYNDPSLDKAVKGVLQSTALSIVDSFKAISGGKEVVLRSCALSEELDGLLNTWSNNDRGLVIVAPHLAGFDMLIFYLGVIGYPMLALSYPDPTGSYVTQNTLRRKFGFNIRPVSVQSLRQSLIYLREGGIVVTAVDRPGLGGEPMEFFGKKVILPIGAARLAIKTRSPMMVSIPWIDPEGIYRAESVAFFEPDSHGDERETAHSLAQKALSVMEPYIREWAERWLMFYPLWPDVLPSEVK